MYFMLPYCISPVEAFVSSLDGSCRILWSRGRFEELVCTAYVLLELALHLQRWTVGFTLPVSPVLAEG